MKKRSATHFGIARREILFQTGKRRGSNITPAKCTTNVPPTEEGEKGLQPEDVIRTNFTTGLFLPGVRCWHDEVVTVFRFLRVVFFDGLAKYGT
jgi:hypothetical protein